MPDMKKYFLRALSTILLGVSLSSASYAQTSQNKTECAASQKDSIDELVDLLVEYEKTKDDSIRNKVLQEANSLAIPLEVLVDPEKYDKEKAAEVMQTFEDKGYVVHKVPNDGLIIGKIEEINSEVDANFGRNEKFKWIKFRSLAGNKEGVSIFNFWSHVTNAAYSDLTMIEKGAKYLQEVIVPQAKSKKESARTFSDIMYLKANDHLLNKVKDNNSNYLTEFVNMILIGGLNHEPEHKFTILEINPYLAQFANSTPFYDLAHISSARHIPEFIALFGGEKNLLKMDETQIREKAKSLYKTR